jgi:hypothetical protein
MIIASGRAAAAFSILSTNGETIAAALADIADGQPDTNARFTWGTGTQTTASTFRLRADWTIGQAPGVFLLSNLSLPPGTRIDCFLRRVGDAPGSYTYQPAAWISSTRVFAHPRGGGRSALFWFKPGATAILGVEFRIFNDVNGAASIAAGTAFTIGEAVAPLQTTEIDVGPDVAWPWIDPTTTKINWNEAPRPTPGSPYRQLTFKLPADRQLRYYGDPADPNALDYEELLSWIDRGQMAVYIPRYLDESAAFSSYMAHRTALIGMATKLPNITHASGPNFTSDACTVLEAPIPV